jgi:hypothetical protein
MSRQLNLMDPTTQLFAEYTCCPSTLTGGYKVHWLSSGVQSVFEQSFLLQQFVLLAVVYLAKVVSKFTTMVNGELSAIIFLMICQLTWPAIVSDLSEYNLGQNREFFIFSEPSLPMSESSVALQRHSRLQLSAYRCVRFCAVFNIIGSKANACNSLDIR